MKTDDTEVAER